MPNSCKVRCIETGVIYDSVTSASRSIDGSENYRSRIANACRDNTKTSGGYHWEYYEEPDLPGEIWKDAKCITSGKLYDFTGKYLVSNKGRLKNAKNGSLIEGRVAHGYVQVELTNKKAHMVHRIVATTFIPNDDPENKIEVNHINEEEKANNCVENLEWCTDKYNNNYGTRKERAASKNMKKVRCITTNKTFNSIEEASKYYNANAICIGNCCKGGQKTAGRLSGIPLKWEFIKEE